PNLPLTTTSTLSPYTTLFRSLTHAYKTLEVLNKEEARPHFLQCFSTSLERVPQVPNQLIYQQTLEDYKTCLESNESLRADVQIRSEEHTSELQSRENLVCRLL